MRIHKNKTMAGIELCSAPSAQSLGVNSTTFRRSQRRVEVCLLSLCGILLLICTVLAVLFAVELSKGSHHDAKPNGTVNGRAVPTASAPFSTSESPVSPRMCNTADCLETAARFTRNMDHSFDPCQDFFHFACGGWIQNNPIPPHKNEYITFMKKIQANNEKLRNMLEDATGEYDDPVMKAKRYYRSCMNEEEVERTTKQQMLELIENLDSWALDNGTWNKTVWNWKTALLKIQATFLHSSPLFTVDVLTNPRNSAKHILKLLPPELSLIREEYLSKNSKRKPAYLEYMTTVGMLLGGQNTTTQQQMNRILEFEEQLARSMPSKTFLYEHEHDTITIRELQNRAPQFQWLQHLNSLFSEYNTTLDGSEGIIVPALEYLRNMAEVLHATDRETLSNYFIWTVLRRLVPFLSKPFREVEANYKRKTSHIQGEAARWLTCITTTNFYRGLTFATGSLFIEKAFDRKMIPLVKEMMEDIRQAFREEVADLSWIDDETRPTVYEKEKAMVEKIGYPEMCVNKTLLGEYYQRLEVDDKRFLLNEVNVSKWYSSQSLSKLRKPSIRGQWYSGPQSVNAYYQREKNEINILAGILQPPYYSGRFAPRAVNFGGIGIILAHELTHGFDNIEADYVYTKRKGKICFQKRKFAFVNGRLTLPENIADNGALKIAFRAYENWLRKHGKEELVPGLDRSSEQMFFLSYAQMWCSSFSPTQIFRRAKADPHALPIYRQVYR
ncbi:Endothelin-converting enzyme 2 [Stylophora pistillata]|uniref:Endothelin-converting enzyme 2 n=1 Tax=Stylophora pistillata TaxID=50429 RepID=A0A2B4S3E2_STYPI|nr:Endothelin-converting enzyme 2 [Stylophora pistillata]